MLQLMLLLPLALVNAFGPVGRPYCTPPQLNAFGPPQLRAYATAKMSAFPTPEAIGVDGLRCAVVFYAEDGISKVESLLELFEDSAEDYASRGCSLVAVRSVTEQRREVATEYEERYPSFNFVEGLEELALCSELGLELDKLMYMPCTYLLDRDGVIQAVGTGGRPPSQWSTITEALHAVTADPNAIEAADPTEWLNSLKEDEAQRQRAHKEHSDWEEVLKKVLPWGRYF